MRDRGGDRVLSQDREVGLDVHAAIERGHRRGELQRGDQHRQASRRPSARDGELDAGGAQPRDGFARLRAEGLGRRHQRSIHVRDDQFDRHGVAQPPLQDGTAARSALCGGSRIRQHRRAVLPPTRPEFSRPALGGAPRFPEGERPAGGHGARPAPRAPEANTGGMHVAHPVATREPSLMHTKGAPLSASGSTARDPRPARRNERVTGGPLSAKELELTNAYWRACNYLSVGMIYLKDNALLQEVPSEIDAREASGCSATGARARRCRSCGFT